MAVLIFAQDLFISSNFMERIPNFTYDGRSLNWTFGVPIAIEGNYFKALPFIKYEFCY